MRPFVVYVIVFILSHYSIAAKLELKMSLKAQITADMKTAMKEKQVERLGTIRLLLAAMKQRGLV